MYELIEGSEVNCKVELDPSGFMSIDPIDEELPYSFEYYEMDGDEQILFTWNSEEEMTDYNDSVNDSINDFMDKVRDSGVFATLQVRSGSNLKNMDLGKDD